jgi:peptide/nickel transport system substrate-binding protein
MSEQEKGQGRFWAVYQDLKAGRITRREFLAKATALGVAAPVAAFVVNSIGAGGASAAPAGGSKGLRSGAQTAPARPSSGTEGQQRGAGGELKMLQWQAATHLSLHNSTGTKDTLAASLVTEPLMNYLPDGSLVPTLVSEVPSVENGGLSADLKTVTYKLLPDVKWSDGQPFTADDVVFTWQWIVDPANQSVNQTNYEPVESVVALDPLTVQVTFKQSSLAWYYQFTGSTLGSIYPKHFWDGKDRQTANDEFRKAPIGTGPFAVESFTENDQVSYVANENYREANKPFFARINLKGGGDAASAAQAVLQVGDWDFAWNLQVEPNILREMEAAGKGRVVAEGLGAVERVLINFSDPDDESMGERSHPDVPHPFLSDKAVRQALSLACDRQTMSDQFYLGGEQEPPGRNILTGIGAYESPNTTTEFNLDKAKEVLEAAGWTGDGVRSKDGVELKVKYFTSINSVRQKNQAVNKNNWEAIGFDVTLGQVDAGVFFDSAAGNDQNASHFFRDLQMYTNNPSSTFPLTYMQAWYAGPEKANIAQKSNGWSGVNDCRFASAEYDALYESLLSELDIERAAETFIKMNDIVINEYVHIPLVTRAAEKFAVINTFNAENVGGSLYEALYWNAANWNRVS